MNFYTSSHFKSGSPLLHASLLEPLPMPRMNNFTPNLLTDYLSVSG